MNWFEQADAEFFKQASDPEWRAQSKRRLAGGKAFHLWAIVFLTILNAVALGMPDSLMPKTTLVIIRSCCLGVSAFIIHFAIMYAKLASYSLVLKYIDQKESEQLAVGIAHSESVCSTT